MPEAAEAATCNITGIMRPWVRRQGAPRACPWGVPSPPSNYHRLRRPDARLVPAPSMPSESDLSVPDAPSGMPAPVAFMPLCSVFRRFLLSRDLKYTPERAAVLEEIIAIDRLFEVEELHDCLRRRGLEISRATVYRSIKLLQDAGILSAALFDNKPSHYQLVFGRAPRESIVCVRTGRSVELNSPELAALRDRLCRELGWQAIGHRLQIYASSPPDGDAAREDQ